MSTPTLSHAENGTMDEVKFSADEAQFSDWHNGWVAFKHGRAVRLQNRAIRVFRTEADAMKAAKKSKMTLMGR